MNNNPAGKSDDFDLITFEVLRNALAAAADEMALMVMRSARSSVVRCWILPPPCATARGGSSHRACRCRCIWGPSPMPSRWCASASARPLRPAT